MDDIIKPTSIRETRVDENDSSAPLLQIFLVIARNKSVIGQITAIFVGLGLLIAIFSPPKYVALAKVILEPTEGRSTAMSGLAALRGFGINITSSGAGLTADTYPDIVRSLEVRLAVARSEFYFPDLDSTMTLVEFNSRSPGFFSLLWGSLKKVTVQLPGTIKSLFQENHTTTIAGYEWETVYLSEEEYKTTKVLLSQLSLGISRTNGIMTIAVTTHDPMLSVQIINTFLIHLKKRVREIYTEKAIENVDFIR
ncbi:MAG: hypothetical protein IIA60_13905, partial [Candidatus Marinimicrobia bacterium]|nr:hypothetical protein [Candidatus Neomarinimicrobiota bacterium]